MISYTIGRTHTQRNSDQIYGKANKDTVSGSVEVDELVRALELFQGSHSLLE